MTNIGRIRTVVLGSSRVGKSGKCFETVFTKIISIYETKYVKYFR